MSEFTSFFISNQVPQGLKAKQLAKQPQTLKMLLSKVWLTSE